MINKLITNGLQKGNEWVMNGVQVGFEWVRSGLLSANTERFSFSCMHKFLAALSSSRSIVVGRSVGPSVRWSVHLCENVTFRLSNGVSE